MKGFLEDELGIILQNQYFFSLWEGKISLPKYIQPPFQRRHDLEKGMKDHMKSRSKGELEFGKVLFQKKGNLYVIPQYPVIIENRDLWTSITGGKDGRYTFYLDWYLPELGIALEVDYAYTHDPNKDYWRDLYLAKEHGILVERFPEYHYDKVQTEIAHRRLDCLLRLPPRSSPPIPDYSGYIFGEIERLRYPELEVLKRIREKEGWDKKVYRISKERYTSLSRGLVSDWTKVRDLAKIGNIDFAVEKAPRPNI